MTYTIVLMNASATSQLDNPGDELFDSLPTEVTVVSATASSGSAMVLPESNAVSWNGSIAGGDMVEITIDALVNGGTGGAIVSNQASILFDADGDGVNETTALTDDPAAGGSDDPTVFRILTTVEIPTLNDFGVLLLTLLIVGVGLRRLHAP